MSKHKNKGKRARMEHESKLKMISLKRLASLEADNRPFL